MNITFLIGNGFDLNLGLETSYKSFLADYTSHTEDDSELIKEFKKDILREHKLWANAESAFGEVTEHFFGLSKDASMFCECHEDFCVHLAKYLCEQEGRLKFSTITEDMGRKFASSISGFDSGFREGQSQMIEQTIGKVSGGFIYNFLIFNYTEIIDKLIETINAKGVLGVRKIGINAYRNQIKDVIHVHGYTDRDMVLGVNDETQIKKIDLFLDTDEEYMDQIIKIKTNAANERNTDEKAKNILFSSDLIYIYGMSIGKTDALWWKRICEIMKANKNIRLIINDFMNAPQNELLLTKARLFDKTKKNEFVSYCEYSEEIKEDLKSRIHIDHSNIFEVLKDYVTSNVNETEES